MKKWRLRKYLKKSEWRSIFAKLQANDQQGLITEVKFNGTVLSESKIEHAIARYGVGKEMISQQLSKFVTHFYKNLKTEHSKEIPRQLT